MLRVVIFNKGGYQWLDDMSKDIARLWGGACEERANNESRGARSNVTSFPNSKGSRHSANQFANLRQVS